MLWLDQCLQTLSCNNPDVWKNYLVIYSTKRKKSLFLGAGLRKAWLTWGFWYNVMPMVMYPTQEKKKSVDKQQLLNKLNAMLNIQQYCGQKQLLWRSFPAKMGRLYFKTATFQFNLVVQKLLCADSIIAHIKNKTFACHWRIHSAIWLFSCFPSIRMAAPSCSSVQLCLTDVRKMSNLNWCLMLR